MVRILSNVLKQCGTLLPASWLVIFIHQKLNTSSLSIFDNMNIREIGSLYNDTSSAADNGDVENQKKCFGMEYFEKCTKYYGPHLRGCLETVWSLVTCIKEGTKYPTKLSTNEINYHDDLNLRDLYSQFNTTKNLADNNNVGKQLECFGMIYPDGCEKYYGPHPMRCLETFWEMSTCLPEGQEFPPKISFEKWEWYNSSNLREVSRYMNLTAEEADNANKESQLKCFGMEYPLYCTLYYGPHPVKCLVTIWQSVACLYLGSRHPQKLTRDELLRIDTLNLRSVISEMNTTRESADSGSKEDQLFCFGMEYPEHCMLYYGPHSTSCLVTIWISVGCLDYGFKYPVKLNESEHEVLDSMNLREIIFKFNQSRWNANLPDRQEQKDCFGMEYYKHCHTYYGPLTLWCLLTIWKEATCIPKGTEYPNKLPEINRKQIYDALNQREVLDHVNTSHAYPANNWVPAAQVTCYGRKFPERCKLYWGPNSLDCYTVIFREAECVREGYNDPSNLTSEQVAELNSMNLWDLIDRMNSSRKNADEGIVEDQLKCFGLDYFEPCYKFYGPMNDSCINYIWTDVVLCSYLGTAYPQNLTVEARGALYYGMHQRAVWKYITLIRQYAEGGDPNYQMECYGMLIPDQCTYFPLHTDECLDHLWINETECTDMGDAYPLSFNQSIKNHFFEHIDLREVLKIMEDNATDQMQCYGFTFPESCNYKPPHDGDCLIDLYADTGCDTDFGFIPTNEMDSYSSNNIWNVLNEFVDIKEKADEDDTYGVEAEACYKPKFVEIAEGLKVLFHIYGKTYKEAVEHCNSLNSLLQFSIDNDEIQKKLERKLHNAYALFDTEQWWLGLNDLENEGDFVWANLDKFDAESAYHHWDDSFNANHGNKHCGTFNSVNNFTWSLEDCEESNSFMCMDVTCTYKAKYILSEEADCNSECNDHQRCVDGKCVCAEVYEGDDCKKLKGMNAVWEIKKFDKTYLFFDEDLTWHGARDYCNGTWGTLAMPKTLEIHEFLKWNILAMNLKNETVAVWLGMNDIDNENEWKFMDDEMVNLSPDFGDMTLNNTLPWYAKNITQGDYWWFIWAHGYFGNFTENEAMCTRLNGTLANIKSKEINDAIANNFNGLYDIFMKENEELRKGIEFGMWFFNLRGDEKDLSIWTQGDGQRVFIHSAWYQKMSLPVPDRANFASFQAWKKSSDPNGNLGDMRQHCGALIESDERIAHFEGVKQSESCQKAFIQSHNANQPNEELEKKLETCGASVEYNNWIDHFCEAKLPLLCERGPYPFERWHLRGSEGSEPNNAWCDEHCGGIKLLVDPFMWNDYHCHKRFPFICEVDLPYSCTYNPPLDENCISNVFLEAGCEKEGHGPTLDFSLLANNTVIELLNKFKDLKKLADADKDRGIQAETCYKPEFRPITFPNGKEVELLFHVKNETFSKAESFCEDNDAVLIVINDRYVLDYVTQKIEGAQESVGTKYWWVGMSDRDAEGIFIWSHGEPFDFDYARINLWANQSSILESKTEKSKDCVAMDPEVNMTWFEDSCSSKNSFICMKRNCDFPATHTYFHRDLCVYLQHDPRRRERSAYAVNKKTAVKNCAASGGNLLVVEDEVTRKFLHRIAVQHPGSGYHHTTRFWLPLIDHVKTPYRINASERNWMWKTSNEEKIAANLPEFIQDGILLGNLGQEKDVKTKLPYKRRCAYGDHQKHVYGDISGKFDKHLYVRSKSCQFNERGTLEWVWTSTYHLRHVSTGLCLTAPFEIEDGAETDFAPGVRVLPCNYTNDLQHWVCRSKNPFQIKLRKYSYSLLLDKIEPYDRVHIAGSFYEDGCKAMWRTTSTNRYICDERYRPGENLFVVKKSGDLPPTNIGDNCEEIDFKGNETFIDEDEARTACFLHGGRIARRYDFKNAERTGFTEGCVCGGTKDIDQSGIMKVKDKKCSEETKGSGIFSCKNDGKYDTVWCYRGEQHHNVYYKVQYAPWCVVFAALNEDKVGFQERSCLSTHYYACQQKLPNTCGPVTVPVNARTIHEDWRIQKQGVLIRCDPGYGIGGDPDKLEGKLNCIEPNPGESPIWDPDPSSWTCERLACPDPPDVDKASLENSKKSGFRFMDLITYRCDLGNSMDRIPKLFTRNSTCNATQQWDPDPALFECLITACAFPPRVAHAKYIGTDFMYLSEVVYKCVDGFWIKRGLHNVTGFICNEFAEWIPDPTEEVYCVSLMCPEPPEPHHGEMIVTSYRYQAKLLIICDIGFYHIDPKNIIKCNKWGDWYPDPMEYWCQNITCPEPTQTEIPSYLSSGNSTDYLFSHELQYMCNETGYELRNSFQIFNPLRQECLGAEGKQLITLQKCIWKDHKYTWIWEGDYQLRIVGTRLCLTLDNKTPQLSDGQTGNLFLKTCKKSDKRQYWHCPVSNGNRLLLAVRDTSPPVYMRMVKNKETVEAVSGEENTDLLSSWMIQDLMKEKSICSYLDGFPAVSSECTKFGYWTPTPADIACYMQHCPELPDIPGTTHELLTPTTQYGARATYKCGKGKWVSQGNVVQTFTCDDTGNWNPTLDVIRCIELICPPPPPVQYSDMYGILWTFRQTITFKCATGYWISKNVYEKSSNCTEDAQWNPDPYNIECKPVECPDPGDLLHASYEYKSFIGYGMVVGYTCDRGYWFQHGEVTKGIECQSDGTYKPQFRQLTCIEVTCNAPNYVPSAQNVDQSKSAYHIYKLDDKVTYKCYSGMWISPGKVTASITCQDDGQWFPPPSSIKCKSVKCDVPDSVPNGVIEEGHNYVGAVRNIKCNEGFWIDQEQTSMESSIECSEKDGLWHPEKVKCQVTKCPKPAIPKSAHILVKTAFTYNESVLFECDMGHELDVDENAITMFSSICRKDGTWTPDYSEAVCKKKICLFKQERSLHSRMSRSLNSTFYYNETLTVTCDHGYWFASEGGKRMVDFYCGPAGHFIPDPEFTLCTVVECPTPKMLPYAVLSSGQYYFNSTIQYTCVTGYAASDMARSWEFVCDSQGNWDGDINDVKCEVVNCGDPRGVEKGFKMGEVYTYGHNVIYTCHIGHWFKISVFEITSQCQADGHWSDLPRRCYLLQCTDPARLAQNAKFYGKDFSYQSLVTVVCKDGYYMRPGQSQITIQCAEDGHWDLNIIQFSCRGVVCNKPPHVWNSVAIGHNYTFGASVKYQCNKNYFLSRTEDHTSVTCSSIGRWSPEPSRIKCLPKTSFLCDPPQNLPEESYYFADSFAYASIINVTCRIGYWFSMQKHKMSLRCNIDGSWEPSPSTLICQRINCDNPDPVPDAHYVGGDKMFNSVRHVHCKPSYLITFPSRFRAFSRQMSSSTTSIVCSADGKWHPDPSIISCTTVNCSAPVIPSNSLILESNYDTILDTTLTIQCDVGFYIKRRVLSTMIKCTKLGVWSPDPLLIKCIPIRCGFAQQPRNSLAFGNGTSYGTVITYKCDKAHYIETDKKEKMKNVQTIKCGKDGDWIGEDSIKNCELVSCNDPGFIDSSSRIMSSKIGFPYRTIARYTCQHGTWFHKGHTNIEIKCDEHGKWYPSDASQLPQCEVISCVMPTERPFSEISPSFGSQDLYFVGENVVYTCTTGYKFKVSPPYGYYSATCQSDGTWSKISDTVACEKIDCGSLHEIEFARISMRGNDTTLFGSVAEYSCFDGYELRPKYIALNSNSFKTRCTSTGHWKPKPVRYSCKILRCSELPAIIRHGVKHGDTYEYGSFVSYVCDEGFILKHPKTGKAMRTIAVECQSDLHWDIDFSDIECIRINCMTPYQPKNATLVGKNYKFDAEVKIKCITGYFFNQNLQPGWNEQVIKCNADEKWNPDPYTFSCAPFDCGEPAIVSNSERHYEATTLYNAVKYTCNKGYVFDFGSGGLVVNEPAVLEHEVKCSAQLAWLPDPLLLRCTKIQCWNPQPPAHGYIAGGEWINNKRHFFYLDDAVASCARGYLSEESLLTMKATCQYNGEWSRNLTNINCFQLSCPNPVDIANANLEWGGSTRYYAKAFYTCIDGYFIRPGVKSLTTQCSHEGYWKPAQSFSCSRVFCGNPGIISNADKKDLSGSGNYSRNAVVEYHCLSGLNIAREQDATGTWVTNTENDVEQSVKIICSEHGKWLPSVDTVHCTESNTGKTMKDFISEDSIKQADYVEGLSSRSNLNITSRMQTIQHTVQAYTVVGEHCLNNQVIIINDIGQWLHPEKKEDVFTKLHPAIIEETGELCDVWNMFDNNPDTYWMPLELPPEIVQSLIWNGWKAQWDLNKIHAIGSIRLHTSDNFVNDVKEFVVEFSSNHEAWTTVGPFDVYNGSEKRSAFFYGFGPIQAQHIQLRVLSTALNQHPIISHFAVYGSAVDCVTDDSIASTTMIVPLFFIGVAFIFVLLLRKAFDLDVKDRWRRYILFIPAKQQNYDQPGKSKIFELSLTTSWKRPHCDVDLLLRVVGNTAGDTTPIMWLRHSYERLLRPGFTDTIALYFPFDVSFVEKIDVVAICKQMKTMPNSPYPSGNVPQSVVGKSATIPSSIQESTSNSWRQNINTEMLHVLGYIDESSEDDEYTVIRIEKIVIRDPINRSKAYWENATSNRFFGHIDSCLKHGILKSFSLQTSQDGGISQHVPSTVKSLIYHVSRFNPITCVFSTTSKLQPIVSNYSRVEKAFIVIFVIFNDILIDSVLHGMTEPLLYFGSDPPKTTSEWFAEYFSKSKVLSIFITTLIVVFLTSLQKRFCGKWHRSVEDPVSFWQSSHPYRAMLHMLVISVMHMFDSCSQHSADGLETRKSDSSTKNSGGSMKVDKGSEYTRSITMVDESPSKEVSRVRSFLRSPVKENRMGGELQQLGPKDVDISFSSGDGRNSPSSHPDNMSKNVNTKGAIKDSEQEYRMKQLYGNFPKVSRGPIIGDFIDLPSKSVQRCIDPISNEQINDEIDVDVLSSLSGDELHAEIVTHRTLPPENPFLDEAMHCPMILYRFILLLGIFVYAVVAIFYVSMEASYCSINTSFDLVSRFMFSMFIDVIFIMPFASCLLALGFYFYRSYINVDLANDKL
uniref:uncharacterized protein LOC120345301 n=1 Tax=Styela clava TaxID=7725 RepID=UPI001939ED68|nr:uncharacterized protein LOC120345301 [Styela clava]